MSADTLLPEDEDPSGKRLTEAEWTEAKTLYELGKATKSDLGKQFGISRQAMTKGLAARGAVYASRSKTVADAVIDAQKADAQKKLEDIEAFKEKQRRMVEMVQNLSIKAVTDKVRDKQPISDAKQDIITLNKLMATIAQGRDELYHIFDLHRDPDAGEQTEEFIVSEYTADEIDALNASRLGISPDAGLAEIEASLLEEDSTLDDLLDDGG
jgi:hypothetical protein